MKQFERNDGQIKNVDNMNESELKLEKLKLEVLKLDFEVGNKEYNFTHPLEDKERVNPFD